MQKMTLEQWTGVSYPCECGETHRVSLRKVIIENDALFRVHELIRELNLGAKAMLLADEPSYEAAGKTLLEELKGHGLNVKVSLYPQPQLYADEAALVQAWIDLEPDTDFIIAVGSGTLNDIARFISYKSKIPYIIVATAPSMDGYASTGSPILVKGFKKTYPAVSPIALVADMRVIRQAPAEMIAAGFGDMAAKLTALSDWLLAAAVEGEAYCATVSGLMIQALQRCMEDPSALQDRDENALKALMEGLVLSGIAMQMIGHSRPASGSEHHISHFLEMKHFAAGHKPQLHGIKVGVATVMIMSMYAKLLDTDVKTLYMMEKSTSQIAEWEQDVRRCYGSLAEEIIAENRRLFLSQAELDIRLERLVSQWSELKPTLLATLGLASDIKKHMREAGAPVDPQSIGIVREELHDAMRVAKEVRSRYTILQLADQLGLLERYADEIVADYYGAYTP